MVRIKSLIREFVRSTKDVTGGFNRVFGPQRRASGVSKQRAGEKVARVSPRQRRRGRLPIMRRGPAQRDALKFTRGRSKKLFDPEKERRLY